MPPVVCLVFNHLCPLLPLQSDLLYRERPRPAGARPGLQPQPPVLPVQLRRRLQGQVLGRPQRPGARQDPGGALSLVGGWVGGPERVRQCTVSLNLMTRVQVPVLASTRPAP